MVDYNEESFFENKLGSWFSNTSIKHHRKIQNLILEYAFDLKSSLNFSKVNREGHYFCNYFKKFLLENIRTVDILRKQTWMNSNPNLWLSWLLMKKDNEENLLSLIPLDPKLTMDIVFNIRTLYPIAYKARILKDLNGEPYFNVTLSALSIGTKTDKNQSDNYSSIYDMLLSSNIIFGLDLTFSQPYNISETLDSGGGDIVISLHPEHIFEILYNKNFIKYLNNIVLFKKEKFVLGDWSGYFNKKISKQISGGLIKSDILKPKTYFQLCNRNPFPFICMIINSSILQNRKLSLLNNYSLYDISIDIMDETANITSIADLSRIIEVSVKNNSTNLAFFKSSSMFNEASLQMVIDLINKKEKLFFDENSSLSEDNFETNQLVFNWNNIEEESPLFKNSYKSRDKPPWRTSIDCIISAMHEKQSRIVSQQPSINFSYEDFRNDAGHIRRFRNNQFQDYNEDANINNGEIEETNNQLLVSPELDEDEVNSPSLVASGFVMGVRCLPATTAITSLGSIIGNNNSVSSNENRIFNRIGTQNQRLSIPLSDRTGRLSSCPTFSSIATSWGTPVPITRTIPIDDILERRRDSLQSNHIEKNTQNEQNHSEIRLKCNLSSEDEIDNQQDYLSYQRKEDILIEPLDNLKINDRIDSEAEHSSNSFFDASIVAKETLKSWKYINYDLGEELEHEEYE